MIHESSNRSQHNFQPEMATNPQATMQTSKNESISAYEMHVTKFTPDSKLRNFTFRGDKTLEFYKGIAGYKVQLKTELDALLLKYQNSSRILDATFYDNTGDTKRVVIIQIVNRVVMQDLTARL